MALVALPVLRGVQRHQVAALGQGPQHVGVGPLDRPQPGQAERPWNYLNRIHDDQYRGIAEQRAGLPPGTMRKPHTYNEKTCCMS